MKKIIATKRFAITTFIIGVVFAVNSFTPAIVNAQYDGSYDSGYYDYSGTVDTGYYDYGSTVDSGYYDYGGTTDSGYYDYGGTTDTGYYDYGGTTDTGYYDYGGTTDTGYYDTPTYDAPVYTAPAYTTPTYTAPDYYSPTYTAPTYTSPTYVSPIYTAPTYTTPVYVSPTYTAPVYTAPTYTAPIYVSPIYTAPIYTAPVYTAPTYVSPTYTAPVYTAPVYTAPVYTAPTYTAPIYNAPTYNAPIYNAPTYNAPVYPVPVYNAPVYNPPIYNAPVYNAPIYPAPVYYPTYPTPIYQPPVIQQPYVTITSNPSVINLGSSSVLSWSSSNATSCYASGGWSGNQNLTGSLTVYPQVSTVYSITCYNNSGQASAQTTVSVNNQQSLAPAVNITATPGTIASGGTSLLVWSSSNASTCYASGAWSGTKNLSGSETVAPGVASTYTIRCSNNVGTAVSSANVFVNSVLGQSYTGFTAACVASPSVATVNRNVSFVAGKNGGTAPYTYSWSGDITGSGDVRNFTFDTVGSKHVTLRVTDANNRLATANCSVQINPVQVSAASTVTTPAPAVLGVATDYATICESLGYIKTAAATCQTYTTCSDGKTYQGTGTGGNLISNTNAPGANSTDNSGDITSPNTQITSAATSTGQNSTKNGSSLLASVLLSDNGGISRLAFMFIWYIAILFFVGFIALIYSAVRPREA